MAQKWETHLGWDQKLHIVRAGGNHPHCDPFMKTQKKASGQPTCLECFERLQVDRRLFAEKVAKKYQGGLFDATE